MWLLGPNIRFRLCVLTHRCLNGTAPPYFADVVRRAADVDGRRHLHSTAFVVPPVRLSLSPLHGRGTVCRRLPELHRHFSLSGESSAFLFRPYWLNFRYRLCKVPLQRFRDSVLYNQYMRNSNNNNNMGVRRHSYTAVMRKRLRHPAAASTY